jgi:hypothetical protein
VDWQQAVDGYCERLGPGFWAEPVNALTNAAFLLAAAVMWRRSAGVARARLLSALLAAIGVGSFLFHTHADRWSGLADVIPIGLFVLVYLQGAARRILGLSAVQSLAVVAAFFPFSAAVTVYLMMVAPWLGGTAGYAPVPLAIVICAALAARRHPGTARGLLIGAGLLVLSMGFRWLDGPACAALPLGTHFLWHLLNAAMLAWMIEVWRRHMLAGAGAGG